MTFHSQVLIDAPVGCWRLGETSGTTAADATGHGHSGTYVGGYTLGATGLDGSADKAVTLNGSSGYINLGNPAALLITGEVTIELIYTPAGFPGVGAFHNLVGSGYDGSTVAYTLDIRNPSGTVQLNVGSYDGTNYAATADISSWEVGERHHILGKYESGAWRLFVDGTPVATTSAAAGALTGAADVFIGALDLLGTPGRFANGTIDEVAIYNFALSDSRIIAHASAAGLYVESTIAVTAASVPASGATLSITTDSAPSASPSAGDFLLLADGRPVGVSAVTGSGTSWTLALGRRWIRAGQTVTLSYSGPNLADFTGAAVTNGSTITAAQVRYVGRKFGMFVCFATATFTNTEAGTGAESPNVFNPTDLDFGQILDGAVSAGMTYAVLTVMHHDGLSLSPSAPTAHNVSASAWYAANGNRNPVREFVSACRERGLGVGLYLSAFSTHFEAANPGVTPTQYTNFVVGNMTDLLTNYGRVDVIWFDGYNWASGTPPAVSYTQVPWETVYAAGKALQPECAILNNNHEHDLSHSDIVSYEAQSDGDPSSGNLLPAEQCHTPRADSAWFWKVGSSTIQTAATIIAHRDALNARRCTYLLNVPPTTAGKLDDADLKLLAEIGSGSLEAHINTGVERTVTLTLTTNGTTPAASLTGLKWAFFDWPTPGSFDAPASQGLVESTNGSGVLALDVKTALPSGGVGYLLVTDSDGTTTQSPAAAAFCGAVEVS